MAEAGDSLHWVESGGAQAPPLVLLHGFGGSWRSFAPVVETLEDRFRILAFDLPGHAGSLAYSGKKHPKAGAMAVLDALDSMGVETFHLCGFSMGGAVACLLAKHGARTGCAR
jgi:pimeloyl-ACP methyl ester carboxylesterase